MRNLAICGALVVALVGNAAAQGDSSRIIGSPDGPGGLITGYIPTDDPMVIAGGGFNSRVLYLNNCKGETTATGAPGCRLTRGAVNNSSTNTTSIASGNLAAYTGSDATWNQIVACVRETYAPYGVIITTTDPGSAPHFEAMAAGLASNLGLPAQVGGVSPGACGIINNAITFSFLNSAPSNVSQACWIIAQESAHAFGLAHEMLGADPMTYIPNPPSKRFQNQSACIGTQGCCQPAQECQCGPTMQNSHQKLLDIFGPSTPTPPSIVIETPTNNATVSPSFVVRATVTDEQGVENVELLVDDAPFASLTTPPYAFNAPASLAAGPHTVTVRANDTQGSQGTASVTVILGDPCTNDDACEAQGAGLVCVDGRCVPGETTPGGLGTPCTSAADCVSGLCATKDGENRCVESCDLAADSCPDAFACLSNGAGGGLCWPDGGAGCLGCATGGGADPMLPIGAGAILGAIMVRRRRRSSRGA